MVWYGTTVRLILVVLATNMSNHKIISKVGVKNSHCLVLFKSGSVSKGSSEEV